MKKHTIACMIIFFTICAWAGVSTAATECRECEEVAKGQIPEKFLDKGIKQLPSGIDIWDLEEAVPAIREKDAKYLWVDTRPGSFLKMGTIKQAVHLVCDLKGVPIAEADAANAISKTGLFDLMKTIDPDINAVTVIFFCQGPKCHRSYNAALRSVKDYGLAPGKVIWFREGYPGLEKYVQNHPKLKRRIKKYLRGKIVE